MARDPIAEIIAGARRRGLDPNAVLAVASVEGLSGGIGDQGTSFGPWQLHIGGALPRGVRNPHQWAWSPAGINYALDRIAGVAQGQRGRQAVASIVRRFERPADPTGEVERAMGLYGRAGRAGRIPAGSTLGAPAAPRPPRGAVPAGGLDFGSVISAANEAVGLAPISPGLLTTPTQQQPMPRRARPQQPVNLGGSPAFKHKRGKTINQLEAFAQPFGVQITSTTHGNHVRGSYHYRGRAVDFGGNPRQLAALMSAALGHPQDFAEAFYSGPGNPGAYIKDGRVYPISQLDPSVVANHRTHVHLAR